MNLLRTYLSLFCLAIIIVAGCRKGDVKKSPTAPVVTTAALTNITSSGATGGGSIVSDGGDTITTSGIVWSESNAMPTLSDSVVAGTTANGTFTVNISGLDFDKSYYIRAFATNTIGTGYGEVVTLNTTTDTNKVRFTYNGEEVDYGLIVSPTTGRKWLDRNLGAKQVATAFDDYNAYGDLFQWGRPADGHQLIIWTSSTTGSPVNGTTTDLATSDVPDHSNFIIVTSLEVDPNSLLDWRDDNNSSRWVTQSQGPCPSGWHVPTIDEWKAEVPIDYDGTAASGGITNSSSAYNLLKLTVAGFRGDDGSLYKFDSGEPTAGSWGFYWSSSDRADRTPSKAANIKFSGSTALVSRSFSDKAGGLSVRCIKDL